MKRTRSGQIFGGLLGLLSMMGCTLSTAAEDSEDHEMLREEPVDQAQQPLARVLLLNQNGDFNGNGRSDILWRNTTTGAVGIWVMSNGSTVATYNTVNSSVPPEWEISGTGDFSGDSKSDILWRDITSGAVGIWVMSNGSAVAAYNTIDSSVPLEWEINGTGDFNGDNKSDILWRNTATGAVGIWVMSNGSAVAAYNTIDSSVPLEWEING